MSHALGFALNWLAHSIRTQQRQRVSRDRMSRKARHAGSTRDRLVQSISLCINSHFLGFVSFCFPADVRMQDPRCGSSFAYPGWTVQLFACCASSLEQFDSDLHQLSIPDDLAIAKAALRLLWRQCQLRAQLSKQSSRLPLRKPRGSTPFYDRSQPKC